MFFIFLQSGYNTRVKAVHIVNNRRWVESLIKMLKFVLKNKIVGRVSVPVYFLSFRTQNLITQHIYMLLYININLFFLQINLSKYTSNVSSKRTIKISVAFCIIKLNCLPPNNYPSYITNIYPKCPPHKIILHLYFLVQHNILILIYFSTCKANDNG